MMPRLAVATALSVVVGLGVAVRHRIAVDAARPSRTRRPGGPR